MYNKICPIFSDITDHLKVLGEAIEVTLSKNFDKGVKKSAQK